MHRNNLIESIKLHEGYRLEPYRDTLGNWTVGYGHLIHNDLCADGETVGSLLNEMSDPYWHDKWLEKDIERAIQGAHAYYPDLDELVDVRQNVLVEMCFQLGTSGLRKFKKLRAALVRKDYADAAAEMLNSRWALHTPRRANTLALEMRSGRFYTR